MKGHEELIRLRMQGFKPEFVFINDYPCKTDWAAYGDMATVCTAGKPLESLDLRFLVGIKVNVASLSKKRAQRLFQLCKENGAVLVAANEVNRSADGWAEIWSK